MFGFFPTSVFLDSTCFSPPFPNPLNHDPRGMSAQQLPGRHPVQPFSPDQLHNIEPPLTRPSGQEKLLLASTAPNYIRGLSFPAYPSASVLYPSDIHPQETLEIKKTVLAPFHPARIVSRMYSNHFPGCQVHGNQVNNLLRKELRNRVIDTTPDFIVQLFSNARKPLIINESFYEALS